MRFRLIILSSVLFLRIILGWLETIQYVNNREIRLIGNVDNVIQNNSMCIIQISRFIFSTEKICALSVGERISVVGTIDKEVIDVLKGEMWLRDAEIDNRADTRVDRKTETGMIGLVNNFREVLVGRLKKFVPEPEAGLIAGIVLGYKKDISRNFYQEMIKSGTIHIAVASGYNIMLVGGTVLTFCFYFVKRRVATFVAMAGMAFYALLAGAEPPVMRALWMAGILYIGMAIGRGKGAVWPLLLTVWFMLMIDPVLLTSISFQLSVAASVGLMIVEPWLTGGLTRRVGESFSGILSASGVMTTFATMMTTMPFLWWHFDRVSVIGILSNILILPLVPMLMFLGTGAMILPQVFWIPAYGVAHWMVRVIGFFGS